MDNIPPVEAHFLEISSTTIHFIMSSPPEPPYFVGIPIPVNPHFTILSNVS